MRRPGAHNLALMLLLLPACDGPGTATPAGADTPSPPTPAAALRAPASPITTGATTAAIQHQAEAISLLGRPLYPLTLDSATNSRLQSDLDSAAAAAKARPDDVEALIWLGRRQAYLGRYRDAIATYTRAIRLHPGDARLYRHRGHRLITVRQLDSAIEDLEHAARLVSGSEDEVEPDGQPNAAGVPLSTLHTNIWYHLGLARYLQHDFEGAAHAFRWGLEQSPNDDMRVAMADWLWLSLQRLGRTEAAAAVLQQIRPDMEILENEAYHRRLLMYRGDLVRDTLIPPALDSAGASDLARATYGYGLAALHLIRGDRIRARTELERVLETGHWPAFGYIAAEAELRAMGNAGPRTDTLRSSRQLAPPRDDR